MKKLLALVLLTKERIGGISKPVLLLRLFLKTNWNGWSKFDESLWVEIRATIKRKVQYFWKERQKRVFFLSLYINKFLPTSNYSKKKLKKCTLSLKKLGDGYMLFCFLSFWNVRQHVSEHCGNGFSFFYFFLLN